MKRMTLFLLILSASAAVPQQQRVLLAVFAHPDDETFAGPVLARYAREGVKVCLAIATKDEKGADEHSPIPPGDPLAKARRAEAECACQKLGIEPPIFFDLNDGELGAMTHPLRKNIQAVADNTEKLIAQLHSEVVVTWGLEGGYGHPDHRLVSDAVSRVIQSMPPGVKLYYVGLTPKQAAPLNREWPPAVPWHTTDPSFLTVSVPFTKADQESARRALECHRTQFSSEVAQKLEKAVGEGWAGQVSFRARTSSSSLPCSEGSSQRRFDRRISGRLQSMTTR
jgi:LmbE family N-acetylglucosaminyl deacetylase